MKTTKLLAGLLGLALGLGLTVSTAAAQAGVEKQEGYLEFEQDVYLDCLGEFMHEIASITCEYHVVTTPGGDFVYHDLWHNLASILIGDSGTVWILEKNISPGRNP